jgi:hypothetical protein
METQIIIKQGWQVIATYGTFFTMTKGDFVEFNDIEYKVDCSVFEVAETRMLILLDLP